MNKTLIVFYFCLALVSSTRSSHNLTDTPAENSVNATLQAELSTKQAERENYAILPNTTSEDESIQHFLDDVVNDWADQMLVDFLGSSMKQFEVIMTLEGFKIPSAGGKLIHYDEGFVNAPYAGIHYLNINSQSQQGKQDEDKKAIMEYIMQSLIAQLADEIHEANEDLMEENGENSDVDQAEKILMALREKFEEPLDDQDVDMENYDFEDEFHVENEESSEKKHEGLGNFFVKRMKFWNQINFEENVENSESYEEL